MSDIAQWLDNLGLARYTAAFEDNDVDLDVLPDLTEADLEDLGVSLGHRKRMLRAVTRLSGAADTPVNTADPKTEYGRAPSRGAEAERRQLTVMFCDLVGSTELAARLDAEDLREVNLAYQRACEDAISRYGGNVARYMGDGVLAYFGYPTAHEDDAERALRSALDVIHAVDSLRIAAIDALGLCLEVRVGVETGSVVVGDIVGEGAAREETVVGQTPNLAARLQAIARPATAVIGPGVRAVVGGRFELTDLGLQTLKGFAAPVCAWRVDAVRSAVSRFDAARGARLSPLVGRDEEFAALQRRWQRVRSGEGQVVLVGGEPGIGKSRLVESLRDGLSAEPHVWLRYQCSPFHSASALHPVAAQLTHAAGLALARDNAQRLARLEALLAPFTDRPQRDVPLLAALLGIASGMRDSSMPADPERQKRETLDALERQLRGLAASVPVLCLFEDLHWIDPSTQELVDRLVHAAAEMPVLLILTFRPEYTPPGVGQAHVTLMALARMASADSDALVRAIARSGDLPDEVVAHIVERTDGVPLFLEEVTRSVLDADAAVTPDEILVPATLHDSLLAALDRLGPARELAQAAAAIGREFSAELLASVVDLPVKVFEESLDRIVASGLVTRRGEDASARFVFKHALVQDVAYGSLLKARQRALHGRIADALGGADCAGDVERPEILAQHLERAGRLAEALTQWHESGRRAATRAAHAEAIEHLTRALNCVSMVHAGDPETRVRRQLELELELASSMRIVDRLDDALAALERAEPLATECGRTAALAEVHLLRGNILFPLGRIDECLAANERAREMAARSGEAALEARALGGSGDTHYLSGRLQTASDYFNRCVTLAREHGLEAIEVPHLVMCASMSFYWMDLSDTIDQATEAARRARDIGDQRSEMVAQFGLARFEFDHGRLDAFRHHTERAGELTAQLGAARFEPLHLSLLAKLAFLQGRPDEARTQIEAALEGCERTTFRFVGGNVYGTQALIVGGGDALQQVLAAGEALLGSGCVSHNHLWFHRDAIEACLAAGEWADAQRLAHALETYAAREPTPWTSYFAERGRALAAWGQGQRSATERDELRRLQAVAGNAGMLWSQQAIDRALEDA